MKKRTFLAAIGAALFVLSPLYAQAPAASAKLAPPPAADGKYERITVHGESLVGNLEGDSPDRRCRLSAAELRQETGSAIRCSTSCTATRIRTAAGSG